jgi:hypothetical protein
MKALPYFAIFIAAGFFSAGSILAADESKPADAKKPAQQLMPLVFLPGGGNWKGETAVEGATWTVLKEDRAAPFSLMAHAGVGDRFPATDASGITQFEVLVENGTADHLALLVISEEGEQKVRVPSDKPAEFTVRGSKWIVTFPTRRVMADPGTRPSTDKAMILIHRQEPAAKK